MSKNLFNLKVIKSFVSVFRVSGFLCYLYISYEHSMYISRIHIWLCNSMTLNHLVKVPLIGQIKIYEHFLNLKAFNCVQTNY